MEYHIWCDESVSRGKYYSDFYGGILIKKPDIHDFHKTLMDKKEKLGIRQEIKWSKVTANYLEAYKELMEVFFDLLKSGKGKVRIMFRQSAQEPINLSKKQKEQGFHLLYYQFIKHAFGLKYSNDGSEPVYLKTYFDKLPDKSYKNEELKNQIYALQSLRAFKEVDLRIRRDDIMEVDSRKHIELQCLDVILGAMAFRLNNFHKIIPEGEKRRGLRTRIKEKLYRHIREKISELYPNLSFNIGVSTGTHKGLQDRWEHPYRHWKFKPKEFKINPNKFK